MSTSFWGDSGGFLDELDGDYGDGTDGQTQVSMSYIAVALIWWAYFAEVSGFHQENVYYSSVHFKIVRLKVVLSKANNIILHYVRIPNVSV